MSVNMGLFFSLQRNVRYLTSAFFDPAIVGMVIFTCHSYDFKSNCS